MKGGQLHPPFSPKIKSSPDVFSIDGAHVAPYHSPHKVCIVHALGVGVRACLAAQGGDNLDKTANVFLMAIGGHMIERYIVSNIMHGGS